MNLRPCGSAGYGVEGAERYREMVLPMVQWRKTGPIVAMHAVLAAAGGCPANRQTQEGGLST